MTATLGDQKLTKADRLTALEGEVAAQHEAAAEKQALR
ncbi:MAG: hypothetical protein QOF73_4401, partial [Thermomicrobiales bacterium]|nr:hypothetical protein [Thermomicrobiales bacterium]